MKNFKITSSLILVIFWMTFIFVMSSQNAEMSDAQSDAIIRDIYLFSKSVSRKLNWHKSKPVSNSTTEENKTEKPNAKEAQEKEINRVVRKYSKLVRKTAHAFEYFVLSLLILNLIYQIKQKVFWKSFLLSILVCFIYACTDEFHQYFIDGRAAMFKDVLIDSLGASIAMLIALMLKIIFRRGSYEKFNFKTHRK